MPIGRDFDAWGLIKLRKLLRQFLPLYGKALLGEAPANGAGDGRAGRHLARPSCTHPTTKADFLMPRHVPVAAVGCGLAITAIAQPANAASLAFSCEERDAGKPVTMTIFHEGEATGAMKIAGSFGEMSRPATKEEMEVEVDSQKAKQTGIRAFGVAADGGLGFHYPPAQWNHKGATQVRYKFGHWHGLNAILAVAMMISVATVDQAQAQWWKDRDGCLVTEHINGLGKRWVVDAGTNYSYVGGAWNDKISTVICEVFCHLKVWEHRGYQGASVVFSGNVGTQRFVGNAWNDRISSMQAWCDP